MKHCESCRIDFATPVEICPVCGGPLSGQNEKPVYPVLGFRRRYHLVRRILLFCSILTVAICVFVNLAVMPHFWWWLIVATSFIYTWTALPHILRTGGNAGGKILMQVVCMGALVMLLDAETGWRGWSVDFVLPIILCIGIAAIMVVVLCNLTHWARYVLYQVVLALLGFLPLVFYWIDFSRVFWAAAVPAVMALASLTALALFGDRSIKNEFLKRFRF
ncbi:DUF6320 domain-containing protein [uncultured Ruthenibacterium sp.]|uniref:DUF6320 domain-containing protein n=1 Tax=uncultured Ruthenibacterium sp. TaxID=1905347 RepID=UPI00349EEE1F